MSYVNIRIIKENVTKEQKATLIIDITSLMPNILGKNQY